MQFPGIARKCSDSLEIGLQFRDSKGTRQSNSVRSLFTSALSYHAIPTTGRWQNKWNQKLSTWQDSNQGAEGSEAKALATWPIGQILMKQKDRLFTGMKGDEIEVRNRSTFPNKNHAILKSVFRNVCFWIFVKHYALVELQERARQSRWPGWPQANFRSPRHAWAIDRWFHHEVDWSLLLWGDQSSMSNVIARQTPSSGLARMAFYGVAPAGVLQGLSSTLRFVLVPYSYQNAI